MASEKGINPEAIHDKYLNVAFKGRIDHDKKAISMTPELGGREEINYVASLLKERFPDYAVWCFGPSPRQIA